MDKADADRLIYAVKALPIMRTEGYDGKVVWVELDRVIKLIEGATT